MGRRPQRTVPTKPKIIDRAVGETLFRTQRRRNVTVLDQCDAAPEKPNPKAPLDRIDR